MKKNLAILLITVLIAASSPFTLTAEAAPLAYTVSTLGDLLWAFSTLKDNDGGGTITLGDDIILNTDYNFVTTEDNPITVDNGNHIIYIELASNVTIGDNVRFISSTGASALLNVYNYSTLTIEDGAEIIKDINNGLSVYVGVNGFLNIMGGTISSQTNTVYVNDGGKATISGGLITASGGGSGVFVNSGAEVTITGGTITATGNSRGVVVNGHSDKTTIVNISGGTIKGEYYGIYTTANSSLINISGGEIASNNNDGYGVYINENCIVNISGNTVISGGASSGIGIRVEENGNVNISGGEIKGNNGISSSGVVNINGGTIQGYPGNGVRIEPTGRVTITSGTIYGNINGIMVCDSEDLGRGVLIVNGGTISGINYGILSSGIIEIRGGEIEGTSFSEGIGIGVTSGTLTVYDGTISGVENGISLGSNIDYAVIYNGTISATGAESIYSIFGESDLPLTVYTAVALNGDIYIDSEQPECYRMLDSFDIISPLTVELTLGENKVVDFVIEGQNLDGDYITLQDLLGDFGTLGKATYTVSNNVITFSPNVTGNDTLIIDDTITYNGQKSIGLNIMGEASDLAITSSVLLSGNVGYSYTVSLLANGGTQPYTWSASGLPGGLSITAEGIISGTPTTAGTSDVNITLSDDEGHSLSKVLRLTISQVSGGGGGGGSSSSGTSSSNSNLIDDDEEEIQDEEIARGNPNLILQPYIRGYNDGSFKPEGFITRAEITTIFYRIMGLEKGENNSKFKDITAKNWAFDYINTLEKTGIIKGYLDETFKPDNNITRAEMASMIAIAAEYLNMKYTLVDNPYTDLENHWAKDEVAIIYSLGVNLYKDETEFKPEQILTRAEAVVMINQFIGLTVDIHNGAKSFSDVDSDYWAYDDIEAACSK